MTHGFHERNWYLVVILQNIKYQIHDGMKIAKTDKQLNNMLALTEYLDIRLPLQQTNSYMARLNYFEKVQKPSGAE